jgi:Mg/Co/Ni transporter MgtE
MKPLESLLRIFAELHPEDAARAFETLDFGATVRLLKSLPIGVAVSLLERASPHAGARIVEQLDVGRIRELASSMPHGPRQRYCTNWTKQREKRCLAAWAKTRPGRYANWRSIPQRRLGRSWSRV